MFYPNDISYIHFPRPRPRSRSSAAQIFPQYTDDRYGLQYYPPGKNGFRPMSADVRLNAFALHALARAGKTIDSIGTYNGLGPRKVVW